MKTRIAIVFTAAVLAAAGFASARALAIPQHSLCSSGYVDAIIGGQHKCLHAGEYCSAQYETDYEHYGFQCVNGRLETGSSTTSTSTTTLTTTTPTTTTASTPTTTETTTGDGGGGALGRTVLLKRRTRTRGCRLKALPDSRCSPGAYHSGLTKAVICSPSFRTGSIRNVPQSEKYAVEKEYGLAPKHYGFTLEIDHIVSLELGGSNTIANLYPEEATFQNGAPGFRVKDALENRLHSMVCSGQIGLRAAQRGIAANWEALYRKVYGHNP